MKPPRNALALFLSTRSLPLSNFLAYAENGIQSDPLEWLDTVNVPYGNGTVDLIMDFTDHLIRGMSLFHCHLLSHEDKGMMSKILFE